MNRRSTPIPTYDPLSTVLGLYGERYPCPDLATLDHHIAALRDRLTHAVPHFPQLVEAFRAEIDLLLDRRLWLELFPQTSEAETSDTGISDAA